jgi:hypothetical protein
MKQLSVVLLLVSSMMLWPQRLTEPATVMFANPQPVPSYTARVTRYRVRQPLTLIDLPAKWQRIAWCESRHRLHAVNNDTYYGLWQIHEGWYKPFGINPKTATIEQQWKVAKHVYKQQGAKAWTCSKYTNFK